jgi:hypothetical protein
MLKRRYSATILVLSIRLRWASRPGRFTSGERVSGTCWIWDWVGLRSGLDAVKRRKISCYWREPNLGHAARSPKPALKIEWQDNDRHWETGREACFDDVSVSFCEPLETHRIEARGVLILYMLLYIECKHGYFCYSKGNAFQHLLSRWNSTLCKLFKYSNAFDLVTYKAIRRSQVASVTSNIGYSVHVITFLELQHSWSSSKCIHAEAKLGRPLLEGNGKGIAETSRLWIRQSRFWFCKDKRNHCKITLHCVHFSYFIIKHAYEKLLSCGL